MFVRTAKEPDLPELFALITAKAEFDGALSALVATQESLHAALFKPQPLAYALVAEVDGKLVGMATYYAIFSSFISKPGLWLDDLFVYEDYRGNGIGEAMVENLCAIAKSGGCARIDWLVNAANDRGKKFYCRIGATIYENGRLVRLNEQRIGELAANVV